jgi:glycyl-tRNA synthetase
VEIASAGAYAQALAAAGVTLETSERRDLVRTLAAEQARSSGGVIVEDSALVAEVANLVEQPRALRGTFDPSFLALPQEVLVTVMKKHQRYFPVAEADGATAGQGRADADGATAGQGRADADGATAGQGGAGAGSLQAAFVAVANGTTIDEDAVRHGNEAVLAARFTDAAYFWRRDLERKLPDYTPELERLAFERRLGSVLDKVKRLEATAPAIAGLLGLSAAERATTARAAALSKSDLATSLVIEMTSLQGVMGRHYALAGGEPSEVADAIMEQYLPRAALDRLPATWAGRCLGLADRVDSLVGLFAVGLRPSGTQDPFGLRRAALGVSAVLVDADADLSLVSLVDLAAETMPVEVSAEARADVVDFVAKRLEGQLRDDGQRADVVAAVLAVLAARPAAASRAVAALGARVAEAAWSDTLTAYARCARIVRGSVVASEAVEAGIDADPRRAPDDLATADPDAGAADEFAAEPAERELAAALQAVRGGAEIETPGAVLDAMEGLAPAIHRFFETVMVMADDPAARRSRLALVGRIAALPASFADFSLLEGF